MELIEQLINILVVGAIVLTVVKTYLTANKIWSRKSIGSIKAMYCLLPSYNIPLHPAIADPLPAPW